MLHAVEVFRIVRYVDSALLDCHTVERDRLVTGANAEFLEERGEVDSLFTSFGGGYDLNLT